MSSLAGKRRFEFVVISSSSSEMEEEEEEEEEEEYSSEDEADDEDYFDDENDEEDEDEIKEEEGEKKKKKNDFLKRNVKGKNKEESEREPPFEVAEEGDVHDRIVNLLKRGKDLSTLKLTECRAYLRILNLRVSGTKEICIQRIQEHWRIKDGNGQKIYPQSSFNIDCTGDVCTGDVILFKQKVYDKFSKVTRNANIIGKRIIAGRVVKESYGARKQQHTFTVEILWSNGVKVLPTLFPLLVKGRNLYRMKTFRRRWNDERERSKILDEKHKRGAVARHIRATAKARYENKGIKHRSTNSSGTCPRKRQMNFSENNRPAKENIMHNKTRYYERAVRNEATMSHFCEPSALHSKHPHPLGSMFDAHNPLGNNFHQPTHPYHMNHGPDALHYPYHLTNHHHGMHIPLRSLPPYRFNRNNHAFHPFHNHNSFLQ